MRTPSVLFPQYEPECWKAPVMTLRRTVARNRCTEPLHGTVARNRCTEPLPAFSTRRGSITLHGDKAALVLPSTSSKGEIPWVRGPP